MRAPARSTELAPTVKASTTASTRRSPSYISYRAFGEDIGVEPDLT